MVPMVRLATLAMLGKSLEEMGYAGGLRPKQPLVAVKAPVFSMAKLRGVETSVGPEMKSTGEVMGVDVTFEAALYKAMVASGLSMEAGSTLLLSISDADKDAIRPIVRQLAAAGYKFMATEGTAVARVDGYRAYVSSAAGHAERGLGIQRRRSASRDQHAPRRSRRPTGRSHPSGAPRRYARIPCLHVMITSQPARDRLLSLRQDAYPSAAGSGHTATRVTGN